MNVANKENANTGLILALSDIESGDWDLLVTIDYATATIHTPTPRHQSQHASQSMSSYVNRSTDLSVSGLLTWEEFEAWKNDNQSVVDTLSENYSEEWDGSNVRGHFREDFDQEAQLLVDLLEESLQAAVSTEYADYSELDRSTADSICKQFGILQVCAKICADLPNITDIQHALNEALNEKAEEIAEAALPHCVCAYVREMIDGYIERQALA
jgi:hypothetical protein